jgi:alpha-L-fucosidase
MTVPTAGEKLLITSLAKGDYSRIRKVSLLGYSGQLKWRQTADGLEITYPKEAKAETAVTFRVE